MDCLIWIFTKLQKIHVYEKQIEETK